MVHGDFNGDGTTDVAMANFYFSSTDTTHGSVSVLLGNGDGTYKGAVSYDSGGWGALSLTVGDFNGDGKLDLAVANRCNNSSDCTHSSVSVLLGNGDGTYKSAVSYFSGGQGAYASVTVGDFNGDGILDLAVANACISTICPTGSVGILLGNGNGTFQPVVSYSTGGSIAQSVAVGDFNGDGKLDLAVANICSDKVCATGSVGVLLGNGDGTYRTAISYLSGGYQAQAVIAGDLNGDGTVDLAVVNHCVNSACSGGGSVSVLLGNGDGTYQAAASYSSGGIYAFSLVVGDFNRDGKPDLAVSNQCTDNNCSNGSVGVLLGNGDGTYRAPVKYATAGQSSRALGVGDFNGDGNADLSMANACISVTDCSSGSLGLLFGNSDGTFQGGVAYAAGGRGATSVAVGDFNGDGNSDLAIANSNADGTGTFSSVSVMLGNGDGTYQAAMTYLSQGARASFVAVGDFNGDGKQDLAVTHQCVSIADCTSGSVSVLLGKGDGTFQPAVSYLSGGQNAQSVVVGDFNGDGKMDLALANRCVSNADCSAGSVTVLLGNGDGTYKLPVSYPFKGFDVYSVVTGDFNADGKTDLAATTVCNGTGGCVSGAVGVLLGNGDGTFQPMVSYDTTGQADSIAVGDFNGDGKDDFAVASQCADNSCMSSLMSILLGNGDGTFSAPVTYSYGVGLAQTVAVADFDGDGKLDLVVADNDSTGVFLGNGDGTFQTLQTYSVGGPGVAVGDFNRDGQPDLAVGGVVVLLNSSPGPFRQATQTVLTSSSNPSIFGQPVSFTAHVAARYPSHSGSPTGTVSFYDGTTNLGTAVLNGSGIAVYTISTLAASTHDIKATYNSDVNFVSSNSAVLPQVVERAAIVLSPASLAFGNEPIGTTSAPLSVLLTNRGNSNLTLSSIQVTGTNSGDFAQTNNCPSSVAPNSSCNIMVTFTPSATGSRIAAVTLTDNAQGSPQNVGLTGLGGVPIGKVSPTSVAFGGQLFGTISNPQKISLFNTNTGNYQMTVASVTASGDFAIQTNKCTNGVKPATHCDVYVVFNPTHVGVLTGTLTFVDNATNNPQTAALTGIGQSTTNTTLTSSPNPSTLGQAVKLTALVIPTHSGTPTGTVTFNDGTAVLGTAPLNLGAAQLITSTLSGGSHSLTASYGGDAVFLASVSPIANQVVKQAAPTIVLGSSPNPSSVNQTVTFTATVNGKKGIVPTGTMVFKKGTAVLGTAQLVNGQASFATAFTKAGTVSIVASYSGDQSYKTQVSKTLKQVVK